LATWLPTLRPHKVGCYRQLRQPYDVGEISLSPCSCSPLEFTAHSLYREQKGHGPTFDEDFMHQFSTTPLPFQCNTVPLSYCIFHLLLVSTVLFCDVSIHKNLFRSHHLSNYSPGLSDNIYLDPFLAQAPPSVILALAKHDESSFSFSGSGLCSCCYRSCRHRSCRQFRSDPLRFLRPRRPKADNPKPILVRIDPSQWRGVIYAIVVQAKLQCFSQRSHRLRCRQYWQH
jgi:hypothetical protein